jgi:hypothetical protein
MGAFLGIRPIVGVVAALSIAACFATPAAWGQSPTPSTDIASEGPLSNIWIGNDLSCQVQHSGESTTEFYPGKAGPGDCGTLLYLNSDNVSGGLFGPNFAEHSAGTETTGLLSGETAFTAGANNQSLTGSGTSQSPYTITTTVTLTAQTGNLPVVLTITEVDSYAVGNDYYSTKITVTNTGSVTPDNGGELYHAGGCFLRGSDDGFGYFDSSTDTPACTLTAEDSPASAFEELAPTTPDTAGMESVYSAMWPDLNRGQNLPNSCSCTSNVNNAEAVEWTVPPLTPTQSASFSMQTIFDYPPISAAGGTTFIGSAPAAVGGTVATFTDPQTADTAGQFSATVNWGDGTSTAGTITGGNGSFAVAGNHTYGIGGSFPVNVTIQQVGDSFNSAIADDTATINAAPSPVTTGVPTVTGPNGAAFSGSVSPDGLATTAYFQYGIPPNAQGPEGASPTFTEFTPTQTVGSDFSNHAVSASVSGLVPNELYDVQLVATNSAGTSYGPVEPFTTTANNPPPAPVLGQQVNVQLVSGHVWIKPPPGKSLGAAGDRAALSKGQGFVPLTEVRQVPTGSEVDALHGSLKIVSNTGKVGKTQTATLAGGVFKVTQVRKGITKGQTDFNLIESAFQGAPTYGTCKANYKKSGDATIASLSSKTLQLLKVSGHGKFRTTGRFSSATVRGTIYTVADKCNGTLTHVIRDTVLVDDFARHKVILLHAGQSYLAKKP